VVVEKLTWRNRTPAGAEDKYLLWQWRK